MGDRDGGSRTNLKWTAHMSNIMLRRLVQLIETGVRTEKGFKEAHLNTVGRQVTEATGVAVSGNQVSNHLHKWRSRWVKICKMREINAALWDDKTNTILLDNDQYKDYINDHPGDAEFLNVPLENYDQMAAIFSAGQAIGRYAMGSNEALGEPSEMVDSGTKDSIPVVNMGGISSGDGMGESVDLEAANTSTWTPSNASEGKVKDSCSSSSTKKKRKRNIITEDEAIIFKGMTDAVKEMAVAVKETVHSEAHPGVYEAVMTLSGFSEDVLLDALSWLYNNMAQSIGFVQMSDDHRRKWMERWITKYYFHAI